MRSLRHPVAAVLLRGVAGALVVALAACSSDATTSSITPSETSRGLTRRLDRAGLCTSAGPLTGDFARAGRIIGISGAWQCVMPPLPDGSSGATEVVTWVAPSAAAKAHVTSALRDRFRQECVGPGGFSASGSSDGTVTPVRPVAPVVTLRYLGDDATKAGNGSVTLTVQKATPRMKVNAPKKVGKGDKATVVVTVGAATDPTGTVTVKVGGKTVTEKVRDGKATLEVRLTKPGQNKVSIRYSGDALTESAADTVKIKVKRR